MELEVGLVPNSNFLLIPVASQNINAEFPSDISKIKHQDKSYKVHEWFLFEKGDHFPRALFLLALGQEVVPEDIWNKYKQSNFILLFVCSPLDDAKKEEKVEIEIPTLE